MMSRRSGENSYRLCSFTAPQYIVIIIVTDAVTGCLTTLKNKFPVDLQDFPVDICLFPVGFTIPYKYTKAMKKHVVIGSDHRQSLCRPSTANILINII